MKIAGYILAFYLLLLAAVPCCAFDSCPDDKVEQTENHEPADGDCWGCSPFFSCESCAPATISYQPTSFEFSSIKLLPVYVTYLQILLPSVEYDFWQPPKIT